MKQIPDKSIDLVLTDPPYGIGMNKKFGNGQNPKMIISDDDWDLEIPPKEYFDEIFRISKNQIIWG
jgi:site-specific DNA-methyltransferase (adenine-specific)